MFSNVTRNKQICKYAFVDILEYRLWVNGSIYNH